MRADPNIEALLRPESIRAQLEKILASEPFAESERLRRFLRFTVDLTLEGGGSQIKEYLLGVEVFGREESFDPRTDAIVRVQAGKLRSRLEKYYTTDGREDPVIIGYPKGSYVPSFQSRQAAAQATRSGPAPSRRIAALTAAGVVVAGLAIYWARRTAQTGQPAGPPASIAVLPFVAMSNDKDQELFCDGITEEIITALSKLEGLRVVARTSSFEFKGKGQDIRKIGALLNVATVLEGSVRKEGNALRITAQLNNVADGYHIWSETYDRDAEDVFAIQVGIAQAIANALRVRMTPGQKARLAKRYTDNLDAYNLYLQGRHHFRGLHAESPALTIRCFEQALALDPRYAPALAGIALAYVHLSQRDGMAPAEANAKARQAAKKALEIDEEIGEAHTALAVILSNYDLDYEAARKEFQRAIELGPNDPQTRQAYAFHLARTRGSLEESHRQMQRALELDPLALDVGGTLARILVDWHEFDNAVAQCRKLIERDPADASAYAILGSALTAKQLYPEAVAAYEKAAALSRRAPMALGGLGYALAVMGARSEAEKILQELEQRSRRQYVSPIHFAKVCAGLGRNDETIDRLEQTYQVRSFWLVTIPVDFRFDALRSEPRYKALLKKMNLPLPEPLSQP